MAGTKRRAYLTEPDMGPKRDFDTSRMTQNKGRTDEGSRTSAPMPSSKEEKQAKKESIKDSLAELRKMGTKSQNFDEAAKKAREETKKRLEKNRSERKPSAGREDRMNRYMEERKRKQMGQSRVVG